MKRPPLLAIAALALGLVGGYILGGVGPRRALVEREAEVEQLEEELAEAPRRGLRSSVPGLDRILRAPERERFEDDGFDDDGSEDDALRRRRQAATGDAGVPGALPPRDEDLDDEGPLAAFRRAAAVQRVRLIQSRAALVEGLEDEAIDAVDETIQTMNDALVGYGEELLLLAMEGERPPPRELLGLTHDVTGILHTAQVELEGIVGEDAEDMDVSALQIWNHIDLELLEPAAQAALEREP